MFGRRIYVSLCQATNNIKVLYRFKAHVGLGGVLIRQPHPLRGSMAPRYSDWKLSPRGDEVNKILKFVNLINGRLRTLKYNLQLMEVIKFVNSKYGTHIVYLGPGALTLNNH